MYRVLFLCDDAEVHSKVRKYLGNVNPDIHVEAASHPEWALKRLSTEQNIDVVVCNHSPEIDGLAFVTEMCRSPSTTRPIVLITENPDGELALKAFGQPVDFYLSLRGTQGFYVKLSNCIIMCAEKRRLEYRNKKTLARLNSLTTLLGMRDKPFEDVLSYVLETCITLTNSKAGYFAVYDSYSRVLRMIAWSSEALKQCRVPDIKMDYNLDETGIWGDPIRTMQTVIVNDYANETVHHMKGIPTGHIPLNRMLMVPIIHNGAPVATAGVANKSEPYDDEDADQLKLLVSELMASYRGNIFRQAAEEGVMSFENAMKAAPFGLFYTSTDLRFVFCNNVAKRLLEITDWEVVNLAIRECDTEGCSVVLDVINSLGEDGYGEATYSVVVDGMGTKVFITVSRVIDRIGRVAGYVSELVDVSKVAYDPGISYNADMWIQKVLGQIGRESSKTADLIIEALKEDGKDRDVLLHRAADIGTEIVEYIAEQGMVGIGHPSWMSLRSCVRPMPDGPGIVSVLGFIRVLGDPMFPRVFDMLQEYSKRRNARSILIATNSEGGDLKVIYKDDGDPIPPDSVGTQFTGYASLGLWTLLLESIVKRSGFSISDKGSGSEGLVATITVPSDRFNGTRE